MTSSDKALTAGALRADRQVAFSLFFCLAWLLFWYRETVWAMAVIWYRSETFNHGFLVLPISLWLLWRRRQTLARLPIRSSPGFLALVAAMALAWLLGYFAAVNAVTQFALVSLLALSVPALLGARFAAAVLFPLGFLFFMVPIGEFTMPTLMDWTAKFTVLALRLSGIPVYHEGLQFVIPSGRWSVVEACSGVRYLIASVCVGMLFAYLNYTSMKKRLLFVAVSILVPVVANWMRAYIIVMIGHLSDGRLAAGVDHLIYGWLFFGVVILIMFLVGARWADVPAPADAGPPPASVSEAVVTREIGAATLVAFLVLSSAPHVAAILLDRARSVDAPRVSRIADVPGWPASAEAGSDWQPRFDAPDATLRQTFSRDGARIDVRVVFYRNQDFEHKLVSSNNVLARSGGEPWVRVASDKRVVAALGGQEVRLGELKNRDGERLTVWHWYWINGRVTASDHLAKVYTALDRLLGRGDDAAAVFVSAPKGVDPEPFVTVAAAAINDALARTRGGR